MRPAADSVANMADGDQNGEFLYSPSGAAQVNKMIREHGELFSDSQCRVCSAVLISESQKLAHYQSKKHANKVRRYMSIHKDDELSVKRLKTSSDDSAHSNGEMDRYKACSLCNMTFKTPTVAESHYQGKVHAKNLKLKTCGFQNPAVTLVKGQAKKKVDGQATAHQGSDEGDPNRFCAICHASFNNPLMAKQHYAGKKHKKQLTKMKLMETYGPASAPASTVKGYPCTVCNIELNSVEQYQAHISGSKHRNHMRLKQESNTLARPAESITPSDRCPPDQQVATEDWRNCSAELRVTRE